MSRSSLSHVTKHAVPESLSPNYAVDGAECLRQARWHEAPIDHTLSPMSTFNSPNKHIDPQTAPPVDKQLRQTFTSSTFYSNSSRKQQGAWMTSRPRITHAKELVAHVLIRTGRLAIGQTLNDDVGAGPTVKPSVSLLPPSSLQISGDSAALLCLLSSYSPQGALVSWTLDGSEVTEGVLTSAESQQDGRYSRSSVLTLSKARWEEGELYVCRVTHDGAPHEVSVISVWIRAGPTVKPSVSLLPPSSLQISGDSAALLCLLSSYSPQGALVSWTLDGSEVTEGVLTSAESQQDGRYSPSSVLTLSKARWEEGELYVCRVTHDGAPHEVSFHKSSEC
ncbi:unnamed protein product [Leuciscus chuanchicus]